MSERLKIGLIGAGVFAGYHANKLSANPRVDFVGVVDRSRERAARLAKIHNVPISTMSGLLASSDAVIIASPASAHDAIATQALGARCHALIEKPLAVTSAKADEIVKLAVKQNCIVQLGHQERLILRAIGLDSIKERPLKIEAVRHSPYSLRGTDTSVTFDLMTHDIDLCTALLGGAPDKILGESGRVRSETADMAYACLYYGPIIVHLSASRVADVSERWMRLTYPSGEVRVDFNAKTLTNSTSFALNANFGEDAIARDSLGAATDIFVRAVLDGTPVLVSAEDGAIAVKVAEAIDKGA